MVFDGFKSDAQRPKAPTDGRGPTLQRGKREAPRYRRDVSRLVFLNAAPHPEIVAVDETALEVNYFIGNDPAKWHAAVPTSQAVLYRNIYDRIDLKVYGIESRIEYDWIVRPGGDPRDIRFQYEHVKGTRVDRDGNLLVETNFGELMHKKPVAYQPAADKAPVPVGSGFKKIGANTYGFEVGAYDAGRNLVIDPVILAYSTYLGGSDHDFGNGIAVDGNGYVYITGNTWSTDFPTLNQYQAYPRDGDDNVFVIKLDATKIGADCLIYSTYLGGSGRDEGLGIAADDSGVVYITGFTESSDFPTRNQYQNNQDWDDAFVTKLDTTKSGSAGLLYSTYLGGKGDDYGRGIAADGRGAVYVTGSARAGFPTLNQCQLFQGGEDGFVTKIDTTKIGEAGLVYSTYLGGSNYDFGRGIAVDGNGNVYVTGSTASANFPVMNPYQEDQGGTDVFVTKLDMTKTGVAGLVYSTYLGGSNADGSSGIAVDGRGNVYVAGTTWSNDFPILNQSKKDQGDNNADGFVTRLDTTKNGDESLVYSTYLGGNRFDEIHGVAADDQGCVYVTGRTDSMDFPIWNQCQTFQGSLDVFVTKFDTTKIGKASRVYSTYLGGPAQDEGWGIAVDRNGNAYVTGCIIGGHFPTLNEFQPARGTVDAFLIKIGTEISANADISVAKTSDNLAPNLGETIHFTLRATNHGPSGASGLKVADSLPAGLEYQASAASKGGFNPETGIWDINALLPGETATLTMTVKTRAYGAITNTASAGLLNEDDPISSNNSSSVTVTVRNSYALSLAAGAGGTTSPAPGIHSFLPGASAVIQAIPAEAYEFEAWSGDASGSANPLTIIMNADKSILASFARVVKPPLGVTGERLTNRNVSSVESVARLRWQANPANPGAIGYRIYEMDNRSMRLIAEVGSGIFEFIVRALKTSRSYQFGVKAVNSQGWESDVFGIDVR